PGMRVLDCGCGPGTLTTGLAEVVLPGSVVGLDVERAQVQRGTVLARERGIANLAFVQGDVYALPFPDASFDAVLVHALFIPRRELARPLREVRRVLRPGGLAGIADPCGSIIEPATQLTDAYLSLWERVRLHQLGRPLRAAARYRQLLGESGFDD